MVVMKNHNIIVRKFCPHQHDGIGRSEVSDSLCFVHICRNLTAKPASPEVLKALQSSIASAINQ